MAWLIGWGYRKSHTINQQAGAGTSYQVAIKAYYGAGVDGTEDLGSVTAGKVYCNSKCQTDFDDVRFTTSDGTTELDYWLDSKTDSDNALYWVEISDNLTTGNVTIYVYYGNAGATYPVGADQAEMDATFPFADHFYGNALDTAVKWTVGGAPTITVAGSEVEVKAASSAWQGIHCQSAFGIYAYSVRIKGRLPDINVTGTMFGMIDTDSQLTGAFDIIGYYWLSANREWAMCYDESASTGVDINGDVNDHVYEAHWVAAAHTHHYVDGTLKASIITNVPNTTLKPFASTYALNKRAVMNYILIRKYVEPEPAHSTWGSQESGGSKGGVLPNLMPRLIDNAFFG